MEKLSSVLSRIMLGLLFALLAAAMALTVNNGLSSPSYLAALSAGALGAALCIWLGKRLRFVRKPGVSLDVGKTGSILTALCALVGLAWVLAVRIEPFSDYETYWQCACALAFGRDIASTEYIAMYPHILGYSTVLSFLLRIFGEHVMVAAVFNVALSAVSGLLIYLLCLRFTGYSGAVLAFLLWIFFPSKLMLSSLVFSEPLYTALILLFFLAVAELERRQERESPGRALLSGAALGLLLRAVNIVRPIAAILIIAYLIWLLLLRGRTLTRRPLWRGWLLITLSMLSVYALTGRLWDGHVQKLLGEEPASFPVYNVYVGFNPDTGGQWSAEDMDLLFSYRHQPGVSASDAQECMLPHLRERLDSGIDYAALFAAKLRAFLGDDELGGYTYRYTRPELFVKLCMVICNVYYYFVVCLALVGLWRIRRFCALRSALLPPLFALGLTLAHMLVEVCNRYHYSLIPILVIFSVFAFSGLTRNVQLEEGMEVKL